jgi:hypothetical protein
VLVAAATRVSTILLADEQGDARADRPVDRLDRRHRQARLVRAEVARCYHPGMRSLFLSGSSSHIALPHRVTSNPGAFVQKPFTVETLRAKVRERLAAC